MTTQATTDSPKASGSVGEVFWAFLKLGLTSFGGPIAHLGYFRNELVERRKWISESQFAQLIAICQFLPGPASSQLGFCLGLLRAGWAGALAAFVAFTLPSALLLFGFAVLLPSISGTLGDAALHGLKIVAVAVVAQGVLGMTRKLCPDVPRASIAALAAAIIVVAASAWAQLAVVVCGAVAGMMLCRNAPTISGDELRVNFSPKTGWALIATFFLLLLGLPVLTRGSEGMAAMGEAFYRAGALVFGGGHVVLPLLEKRVVQPGWISQEQFLAGYGAAQAVPGPMFSFVAYLGACLPGEGGAVAGAALALAAIFLPGFLLVAGALPVWKSVASHPVAARAVAGVNAAVVGILGAALYNPVWSNAVRSPPDFAIALIAFTLLIVWRTPALIVVGWCVAASMIAAIASG